MTLDISGLGRLLGDARAIGERLRRAAADRGLAAHVAVAATESAAVLLACGRPGLTVAGPGDERRLLADLPLSVLGVLVGSDGATGPGCRTRASIMEKTRDAGLPSRVAVGVQDGRVPPSPTADRRPAPRVSMPCRSSQSIARSATFPAQSPAQGAPATEQHTTHYPLPTIHYPLSTVLRRWGLRTLGELAALPPPALSERLGQDGVRWQRLARGEDPGPLVPDRPEKRYAASLDLEWPIEGLEPLSFVLGRLFEPLCAELERDDRAAAVLHVALTLVTRETEARTLNLPAPMRDPRVLRTLVLLNLESHPITAGIDRVTVTADPAPGRIVQCSLLGRSLPLPEQIAPLMARLGALMGENRVGAAALVDSHRPEAFRMTAFAIAAEAVRNPRSGSCPGDGHLPLRLGVSLDPVARLDARATARDRFAPGLADDSRLLSDQPQRQTAATRPPARGHAVHGSTPDALPTTHYPLSTVLRRFRFPVPARVVVQEEMPVRVTTDRRGLEGGRVERCAGPWITSGEWWRLQDARLQTRAGGRALQVGWNRDEWDVALGDGGVYRIYRDRDSQRWFVDGIVD